MANPKNTEQVAMLSQRLENTSTVLLTEYRGLTVKQITALRKALGSDAAYVVAKNTLVKRAAQERGIEGLDELLTGPTAVTFVSGEAVDAAKALKEFSKENKALVIKGGYMDGTVLTAAQVEAIADMDNRETTLAKLAGALKGSLTKAACLFNAPATKAARLAVALQEKKQDEA